jgi:hypothetical protein
MALPVTEARFGGSCGLCDDRIEPGDRIARLPDDDEFVHAQCAENEGHDIEGDE